MIGVGPRPGGRGRGLGLGDRGGAVAARLGELDVPVAELVPGEAVEAVGRLVEAAAVERVGERLGGAGGRLFEDRRLYDYRAYPPQIWKQPGEKVPNRAALGAWGAWVNSFAKAEYGRPLFIAASADLAESTNLAGFGKGFGDLEGWGWYERDTNPRGALLPTEITDVPHPATTARPAHVNLAPDPPDPSPRSVAPSPSAAPPPARTRLYPRGRSTDPSPPLPLFG